MRRSLTLFLVLAALLWQSVAMARIGSSVNRMADLDHAVLHWQQEPHAHHDDGSYERDDSSEALQHVVLDHSPLSAAVTESGPNRFQPACSAAPRGARPWGLPDPAPDRLLRPPRQAA